MFCTKCGFDAQDAKFCPRCGNRITDETQQQTPNQAQNVDGDRFNNQQAQQQNFATGGANTPPQSGFGMPGYNAAQASMPYTVPKKKKRWPLITALAVIIAALLGVGVYFAYPYVRELISPKRQAIEALKSVGYKLADAVDDVMDNSSEGVTPNQQSMGIISFDSFSADGEDFLSYVKVDTLQYDVQTNIETGEMSGTIGLANGSSDAVMTLNFYTYDNTMYFNIPELFSENFRVDLSDIAGGDWYSNGNVFGYLFSGSGSYDISAYSDVVNAAVKDILSGYYRAVEEFEYKKLESTTLEADGLKSKVSAYRVTVTSEAVLSGFNKAVDALFDDSQVSVYLNMLSAYGSLSRESLKAAAASELAGMRDAEFTLYTRSGGRMAGIDVDLDEVTRLSMRFLGDDLSDHVNFSVSDGYDSVAASFKESGNDSELRFNISLEDGDFIDAYICLQSEENSVIMKDCDINMDFDGTEFELGLTGTAFAQEFSKMKFSAASFNGALNPERLTTQQQTALVNEFAKNGSVLKNVVSDELYKSVDEYIKLIQGTSRTR